MRAYGRRVERVDPITSATGSCVFPFSRSSTPPDIILRQDKDLSSLLNPPRGYYMRVLGKDCRIRSLHHAGGPPRVDSGPLNLFRRETSLNVNGTGML